MSNTIQIKSLSIVAATLTLSTFASAQSFDVPTAGPRVLVAAAPSTMHIEAGATRSFEMRGSFAGLAAANELSSRLMARGHNMAPQSLNLVPSPDGTHFNYVGSDDPSAFVTVNQTTGDVSFCRGMKGFEGEGHTENLPRGEQAVRGAVEHLERLNLLPSKREEMIVQHIGGLRMSQQNEDASSADFDKLTTVHFGRQIDGLRVGGPGSKIIVHLGADGELVGLQRRWVEVQANSHASEEFLNRNETVASVEGHLRNEWTRAMKVSSEAPMIGLFDDGNGIIEPAFFFRAELEYDADQHEFAKGEYTNEYLGILPALRSSRARFQQLAKAPVQAQDAPAQAPMDPINDDEPSNR